MQPDDAADASHDQTGHDQTVAAARLRAQWLTDRPARDAVDVVRHLLAVQAQDATGARLAVRARSRGLASADVDAALERRGLVVTWLNRGTLHLVTAADYWWLHPLTAPRTLTGITRRLRQTGVSAQQAERGLATIEEAVRTEGPRTRAQLKAWLIDAGVPTDGQALIHVLAAASLAGLVVRGPVVGADQAYALVEDWLGPPPAPLERGEALARLSQRYRASHALASAADLASWAGVTLSDARAGLAAAGDLQPALEPSTDGRELPAPMLLGPFDPALHGWPDRDWLLGPYRHLVTSNGMFRAGVLVGGRIVGTWTRPRGQVELSLFEEVLPAARQALREDGADVARFLGAPEPRRRREPRQQAAGVRGRSGPR